MHNFLTLPPTEAQGTYLSPEAFYDGISIRYGRDPVNVPARCSCREQPPLSLEHALTCPTGGNVIGRHNMVRDELRHLSATATVGSQWAVEEEVWISDHLNTDLQVRNIGGDGKVTQVDVRICHPAAQSYLEKPTDTILSDAEKAKKIKYEATCRRRGEKFVPFIITTDGALGAEANNMISKIASATAEKLKMQKSNVLTWARSRIATALVRACSACIRGSRGRGARDAHRFAEQERSGVEESNMRQAFQRNGHPTHLRTRTGDLKPNPTSQYRTLSTSSHQKASSNHRHNLPQPIIPPPGLPNPRGGTG